MCIRDRECIGQIRNITLVNTQGFYSTVANQPDASANRGNGGRGPILWWGRAAHWQFADGVCRDVYKRQVYVIEGLLKADISHCLTNRTFAAIAGANNTSQLDTLFALLAQNGTEEIIEAHDMDKYSCLLYTSVSTARHCSGGRSFGFLFSIIVLLFSITMIPYDL